ncbi:MAG: isochorismate synthase [Myxococcales bacterium]|nr:isochorismate synthase [Myxococcales bacterium]
MALPSPAHDLLADPWALLAAGLDAGERVFAWARRGRLRVGVGVGDAPAGDVARVICRTFDPGAPARPDSPWQGWPARGDWTPARVAVGVVGPAADAPVTPLAGRALEPEAAFCARIADAEAACAAGALAKVVAARALRLAAPPGHRFDPLATLHALAARHPDAATFLVGGAGRWFVGATPEILVRLRAGAVETHALAGTRPRPAEASAARAAEAELLASPKDRREHAAVVTAIQAALAPLCHGVVTAPTPRVRRLPDLLHLETPVRARLRPGVGLDALIDALHPTPALGGWPAASAQAWLRAHEPLDRGAYGAPIGFETPSGEGVVAVGIRSALLTPAAAWAFAGAGVVAGSSPGAEWQETAAKLGTATAALRVAPR